MNRERAKELLPIIEAFANGEDVQILYGDGSTWQDSYSPIWLPGKMYRIKPKPREFWICPETQRVLMPSQKDLSADHQYIKVREVLE